MAKRDENGLKVGYKREYKGLQVMADADNPVQAVIDIAITGTGRPSTYPATETGFDSFVSASQNYLQYVAEKNKTMEKQIVLDIESWAVFIGATRATINKYQKRGGQWTDFISWFKELITAQKKQAMFNYAIPPVVGIFDLKNNAGYTDKTEIEIETPQARERVAVETEIEEHGLVWNEETQSFENIGG